MYCSVKVYLLTMLYSKHITLNDMVNIVMFLCRINREQCIYSLNSRNNQRQNVRVWETRIKDLLSEVNSINPSSLRQALTTVSWV